MVDSKTVKETDNSEVEADGVKRPLYVRQIGLAGWPVHVEKLAKENLELPVNIHHISAALVFMMCVECGFVPDDKKNVLPDAETIYKTLDCDKIPRFAVMYPDSSRVPDCRSVIFRAILDLRVKMQAENNLIVDSTESKTNATQSEPAPSTSKGIKSNETSSTTEPNINDKNAMAQEIKSCVHEQSLKSEASENPKARYIYSPPVKLVMEILNDCIQINGIHQGCDLRNYRLSYKFKIDNYLKKPIQTENEGGAIKKMALEWISDLSLTLDAPQMVQDFKSDFALPLMDSVGGISNEVRGIQSLPPEVLMKILTLCAGDTVRHVGQTSRYLKYVTDDQSLWRNLLWRDYRNSRQGKEEVVLAAGRMPPDYSHDYKDAYKRLWLSSPERIYWRNVNLMSLEDSDSYDSDDYDDYFGRGYGHYYDDDDMGLFGFI